MTSLPPSSIYALMRDNAFPKPVALSANRVAWVESEIAEWMSSRISAYRNGDDVGLKRGRKEPKPTVLEEREAELVIADPPPAKPKKADPHIYAPGGTLTFVLDDKKIVGEVGSSEFGAYVKLTPLARRHRLVLTVGVDGEIYIGVE
jgi:prophage regulatory protein